MITERPTPATARLKVVMDRRGRMRLTYDGQPVTGVMHIEAVQDSGLSSERAEITVKFMGTAVGFETEADAEKGQSDG